MKPTITLSPRLSKIQPLTLEAAQKDSLKKILGDLRSGKNGLTDKEAFRRSRFFGLNEVAHKKKIPPLVKLFSYFKSPLIIILLVAASISGLAGEFRNFLIIMIMVFLGVILNFYQEHKSNQAAEKIAHQLEIRATALRNGAKKEILAKYIVPGDVLLLSAGDIVPADGRIISADDFFVNESALTGESFPVEKKAGEGKTTSVLSGTHAVSGYCYFIATSTGGQTEYGRLAQTMTEAETPNAFENGIKNFGFLIIKIIILIVLLIFLVSALEQRNIIDSFVFALAVAVGVTPELLPMIMSVNMAKGSINMAKKGVLVKRLNAIPDFGSMDILCTDKTGTLTQDRITLVKHLNVFGTDSPKVLRQAYINGSLETGIKSILDKAILEFKDIDIKGIKKIDEIPYDFMRKRSSVIYEEKKKRRLVTKGAPEEIFKICTTYEINDKHKRLTPLMLKKIQKLYDGLSNDGLRVLAIATREIKDKKSTYPKTEEKDLTLIGFTAFYDPPKVSAKETIAAMREYGIEVKILTGDSPLVTKKICSDLGLDIKGILVGEDLDFDKMNDKTIASKAADNTIFARFSPIQKNRIISALKKDGYVVGYLGDGINDAPSLKTADVAISVSNAVDVAKEAADIILVNKGLKELMEGVIEGRKTFGNTMKYLMMGLSSNFGNMFSMVGAVIYLPFFPMLPGQILLNNLLYDTSQLTIPTDNVDVEYLRKPRHWDMRFIKYFMVIFGLISSVFDILTFILLFGFFGLKNSIFQSGWFIESLLTQTLVIYIIRTRKIPFLQSRPSKYLLATTLLIISLGIMIISTKIGHFFGFGDLPWTALIYIFVLVLIYLLIVEIAKQIFYRLLRTRDDKEILLPAKSAAK